MNYYFVVVVGDGETVENSNSPRGCWTRTSLMMKKFGDSSGEIHGKPLAFFKNTTRFFEKDEVENNRDLWKIKVVCQPVEKG